MNTFTLYFADGQTYTNDFAGIDQANEKGAELAKQDSTEYLNAEQAPEVRFYAENWD